MKIVSTEKAEKKPFHNPLFTSNEVTKQILLPESVEYEVNVVNFGKGVRNKFHSHDHEQILIITKGKGIVATDKEERVVTPGDVVFIPAGEKHWHGATADSQFSHIFVTSKDTKFTQLEN